MLTFPAPPKIDGAALTAQLAAAGLPDIDVQLVEGYVRLIGTDDRATARPVVATHDGAALPLPPERQADEDARTQLTAIRAKAKQVAAGEGTFTAAQTQKILAQLILRATR